MRCDLNKIIDRINNYIYANEGLDSYEVLNELLKIFYIKVYDEKRYNSILSACSEADLLYKIGLLFEELKKEMPMLFDNQTELNLKNETIIFIMKELKYVVLSQISSDVKGHLMQRILDRSFREARGQFFTPAQVVEFIIDMIDPKPGERGCDPACGTGGFMFAALERMHKSGDNISEALRDIDFYDISETVIRLVKMRCMFEFSSDCSNVSAIDSIASDIPAQYDFIITNPPFGSQGRISTKSILAKYSLGHNDRGELLSSQVPDVLFVEKVISMLKEGGRGAIVLPDGVFENPSMLYIREYLIEHTRIDAIVSLPDGTFIPYGTGVKSSILFFTKLKGDHTNYSIFFGKINNLGYTFSKHSRELTDRNGNIVEDYTHVATAYHQKSYDDDNFMVNINTVLANGMNLSQHFYSPKLERIIACSIGAKAVRLGDLVTVESKKQKFDADEIYRYVEISDINSAGCEIINCTELQGSDLPSRASYLIKKGQLIVAIAGNSIGSVKNAKAIVSDEYDGCICTNGFIVLNPVNCSAYLLLHFFNSEAFRAQVRKYRFGTAIPTIAKDDFLNLLVPIYSYTQEQQIIANIRRAYELRAEATRLFGA